MSTFVLFFPTKDGNHLQFCNRFAVPGTFSYWTALMYQNADGMFDSPLVTRAGRMYV